MSTDVKKDDLRKDDQKKDDNDQEIVRREKLNWFQEKLSNPYRNGFVPTIYASHIHKRFGDLSKDQIEAIEPAQKSGTLAGRILAIRSFGKAAFIQIKDRTGRIQIYVQKDAVGEAAFEAFQRIDIGDIVCAEGHVFRTKTNELSIAAKSVELVTKSLHPMPEKFHGLTDVELKYRKRYLDLIVNDETQQTFVRRSKIVDEIRRFFVERDYIEVDTPMLHSIAGGATAKPFKTHHNALDMELFLRIAPELHLKRLIVGGLDRVFEINRCFRNEGISIKHNPEFTSIEFYQAYATFEDFMPLTEELFQRVAKHVLGTTEITYQGRPISLAGPWQRIRVEDAIIKYSGFNNAATLRDRAALLEYGKQAKIPMNPKEPTGALQMAIFDAEVESLLVQPTFVTHYPLDVSPLSRKCDDDPYLVDRFELYMNGWEVANAFSELNDPRDQRARFEHQVAQRDAGNDEAHALDEDFVHALEYGMPPTAGEGIGIDRMVMLLTDSPSIRDVILFPQMRHQS